MIIVWICISNPGALGYFEHVLPAIGVIFVGAKKTQITRRHVHLHDIAEEFPHNPRRLRRYSPRFGNLDGVVAEIWYPQVLEENSAISVRVGAHPPLALRGQLRELRNQLAGSIEQLIRSITLHPLVEDLNVRGFFLHFTHRHLMGAPIILSPLSVDLLRSCPPLGGAQNEHWPPGAL